MPGGRYGRLSMSEFKISDSVILPSGEIGLVISAYPTSKNNYHLVLKRDQIGVLVSGKELMPAPDDQQKKHPF